jgi:SAM-dependent methyltransferase
MTVSSFDAVAADYEAALDDPWRRRFAGSDAFFIHQKCRAMLRRVARDGDAPARPSALDVGCGKGPAVAFLGRHWRTFGTDVSHEMLKRSDGGLRLAVQEPFALPFADDTFDVVFAFCVYHHVPADDHVRHAREMLRVARPGGRMFVFEHNPYNPVTRVVFGRAAVDRGCTMIAPAALRRTLDAAGLVDLETEYVLFLPQVVAERAAAAEAALRRLPIGGQYGVTGRKPESLRRR